MKQMLVLISEGGEGHKIAGDSLKDIFSSEYDVDIVNVITKIIHPLDFLHTITSGAFTGEDLYNFMLRKGYHKSVNVFVSLGDRYMQANQSRIEKLFDKYLEQKAVHYDLVISTVPFVNGGIAKVLQKRQIPLLIMPINLDTSTFFLGMKLLKVQQSDKILFAFPYEDGDLRKKSLRNINFPKEKIVVTGFPVRKECQRRYSEKDVLGFKEKHGISPDKSCVTMVLGGSGHHKLLPYTQALATLPYDQSLEINICVGKNEKMWKKILRWFTSHGATIEKEENAYTSVKTTTGLIFHVRKFTQDFVEILASSLLIITRTGSCAVNEAIYLGKKLLLDNTEPASTGHLFWEIFNLHFVRKHGLGDAFNDLAEMTIQIQLLLQEDLGHPVQTGAFPLPDFKVNVEKAVANLLS